ncbi:MAG: HU family DNA-binding protein [Spirochaetota bacterium]|nr:HU family DNA-binding protein [Spirochaetota bacterium]
MENNFNNLSDTLQSHLRSITGSSGLPDTEESLDQITKNWFEKKELFEEQIKLLDMIEVDSFKKDDKKGTLMLTYSGSLISLSSLNNDCRRVEYSSIQLRGDVPDIITKDDVKISYDTGIDQLLEFEEGPIKKTSALLKIAVCKDDVNIEEQDLRIREATIFLTNGFLKINQSLSLNSDANIGQFTMKSIVSHISKRNNITNKQAKQIIDDYILILESGMLLGERVSVGRLGRMHLKMKPAQKARIGRNPHTGEDITIKAKPEMLVPKMTFSKYIKERSIKAKISAGFSDEDDTGDDNQ